MDYNVSPLYDHVSEYLPLSKEVLDNDTVVSLFFNSVRYVEGPKDDHLLVRALDITSKVSFDIIMTGLSFYSGVPLCAHSTAVDRAMKRNGGVKKQFTTLLHNSDTKRDEQFVVYVFHKRSVQKMATNNVNYMLRRVHNTVYSFGDHDNTFDGNTVAVTNNVLCSHLYHIPAGHVMEHSINVNELIYDAKKDAAALMNLNTLLPFMRREGAFDIETIVNDANMGEATNCKPFVDTHLREYRNMFLKYNEFKQTWKMVPIDAPPKDSVVMKRHRITSVSLVVTNYHVPKSAMPRKQYYVFYDRSVADKPIDLAGYAEKALALGIDIKQVTFQACDNEYHTLLTFLKTLLRDVDTLYVYNANFDVAVLKQRLAYYAFKDRHSTCCSTHVAIDVKAGAKLTDLWEYFLSKQPDLFRGTVHLGADQVRNYYTTFLHSAFEIMEDSQQPLAKKMIDVAKRKTAYLGLKARVQNFKMTGYGAEIIDLHLMLNQSMYDECNSGKLDNKAHLIIKKFRPLKNPHKMRKLADISYDKLDAAYKAGGESLTECLVYNLIDSQLLIRIARYVNPLKEYIFRQVSTYNVDQLVHTRGQMQFNGFVASMKSVEISRFKARLDNGSLISTGYLKGCLYDTETIPRRGGYVLQPLTGLTFSTPACSFEGIVDFASMYPGIICDHNISSESIVSHGYEKDVPDYMAYDWSSIENGFQKYTLVLRVDRSGPVPKLVRHVSDTSKSLKRYLSLRKYHKDMLLQDTITTFEKEYHHRLQNEMKICANSHYGTADLTCSLMITTQGQHNLKLINAQLHTQNIFPNYGDTDSTMFWVPSSKEDDVIIGPSESTEDMACRAMSTVANRLRQMKDFVQLFVRKVKPVMLDDVMAKLVLLTGDNIQTAPVKDPKTGRWFVLDPETGTSMDASGPFETDMITKLEYESCSSITCHVAKKMVSKTNDHQYKDNSNSDKTL